MMRIWLLGLLLLVGCSPEPVEPTQEPQATPTRTVMQVAPEQAGEWTTETEWYQVDGGELSDWIRDKQPTRTVMQVEPKQPDVWTKTEWQVEGELSDWISDIEDRRACEMEAPDMPIEVVRRYLASEGKTESEVIAAVATAPLKKMSIQDEGYVEFNQMVLMLMRSQPDVPDEMVVEIEHCIAKAGGPHEHG